MNTKKKKRMNIVVVLIVVLFGSAVFLFIRYSLNRTIEEPEVNISHKTIEITGMYGESYSSSDIKDIQLIQGTPQLGKKIKGSGISSKKVYKGHYEVDGLGVCRVFLNGDTGLYIMIETEKETVLVMFDDRQKIIELFENLREEFYWK